MKNVLIIERKYKLEMCQARWERDRYRKKERKKERKRERYRMKKRDTEWKREIIVMKRELGWR